VFRVLSLAVEAAEVEAAEAVWQRQMVASLGQQWFLPFDQYISGVCQVLA